MRRIVWCLLAIGAAAAAPVRVQEAVELFSDDFSRFPPGVLSAPIGQLNGAIQEYHYIEHRGVRTFPWRNPIVHLDSWAAGDERSEPYLEQHLINDDLRFSPLFVTGDKEWRDYRVEVLVKPLSLQKDAGLAFRYRTSRHYYRLALEGGTHRSSGGDSRLPRSAPDGTFGSATSTATASSTCSSRSRSRRSGATRSIKSAA